MPPHVFHQHLQVPAEPTSAPRPKRVKIDVACVTCRMRKVKCDGARPGKPPVRHGHGRGRPLRTRALVHVIDLSLG
jgi:hypothetical protein